MFTAGGLNSSGNGLHGSSLSRFDSYQHSLRRPARDALLQFSLYGDLESSCKHVMFCTSRFVSDRT